MFLTINPLLALNEDIIFSPNDKQKEDMFEKPIILEPSERAPEEKVSPYTKEALRAIITKDYDLNSSKGMFDRQLSAEFHRGIIKNTTFHTHVINTLGESISDSDSDFTNNVQLINVGLSGKFKGEKENYSVLFDLTPNVFEDFSHGFILDAFIESGRIKNNTILVGASRPQVGYEGGNSAKTIPFLMRSQTARTFSNVRKTGIKVDGKYKWVDYEVGGFSSDVRYYEFFPGVEGNLFGLDACDLDIAAGGDHVKEPGKEVGVPLDFQGDAAVVLIFNPAGEAQLAGGIPGPVPEPYPLDPAGDAVAAPHRPFGQGRRGAVLFLLFQEIKHGHLTAPGRRPSWPG